MFQASSPVQAGPNPVAVAAGDLNNDGTDDVVVVNGLSSTSSGDVRVFFGIPGSNPPAFQPQPVILAAGTNPDAVAVGTLRFDANGPVCLGGGGRQRRQQQRQPVHEQRRRDLPVAGHPVRGHQSRLDPARRHPGQRAGRHPDGQPGEQQRLGAAPARTAPSRGAVELRHRERPFLGCRGQLRQRRLLLVSPSRTPATVHSRCTSAAPPAASARPSRSRSERPPWGWPRAHRRLSTQAPQLPCSREQWPKQRPSRARTRSAPMTSTRRVRPGSGLRAARPRQQAMLSWGITSAPTPACWPPAKHPGRRPH